MRRVLLPAASLVFLAGTRVSGAVFYRGPALAFQFAGAALWLLAREVERKGRS